MSTIFLITVFIILLYLIYPLWLFFYTSTQSEVDIKAEEIKDVSIILLSFNGQQYLDEKINFLIKELSCFQYSELIIIDDNSTDGSKEIINNFMNTKNIKIILKNEHKGISHSMNMGTATAKYENIVFCDQRQILSDNIIKRIIEPLKYEHIGAVSSCISHIDKDKCYSIIRRHENFIKSIESNTGNLIGVYGPFYAIKKNCYSVIPDYIILDDLYLSLKIIKIKQIKIIEDCKVIDENFSALYNFKRTKKYLLGFFQILKEKELISQLKSRQLIMLLWHKYLRLLIPFFLCLSYICVGIMGLKDTRFLVLFIILTTMTLLSVFSGILRTHLRLNDLIRINILYFMSILNFLFKVNCYDRIIHVIKK